MVREMDLRTNQDIKAKEKSFNKERGSGESR
jgi:hypothetical protein